MQVDGSEMSFPACWQMSPDSSHHAHIDGSIGIYPRLGANGQQPGNGNDQQGQERTDPLGRPLDQAGSMAGGTVKLPDQSDLARAREILDELRKRAGEASRAQEELDYIERLLKQF